MQSNTQVGRNGGGNITRRCPPSLEEKKLIDVLQQISIPRLTLFLKCIDGWQFEKQANLYYWKQILKKMETLLKGAIQKYPQLLLVPAPPGILKKQKQEKEENDLYEENNLSELESIELVYQILRFLGILLENSSNKQLFQSTEQITSLLGARNEYIILEATHVIAMLALPPLTHRHAIDAQNNDLNTIANVDMRKRLLEVVHARGPANSSTDLVDFLTRSDVSWKNDQMVYQFYSSGESKGSSARLVTVTIPPLDKEANVSNSTADITSSTATVAASTCEALVQEYNVPENHIFKLFAKIRCYYASRSKIHRQSNVLERLYALVSLFFMFSDCMDVTNCFEQNPELTRTLAELVRVDFYDKIPLQVQSAALHALTALVCDRVGKSGGIGVLGRQSNVLSSLGISKGSPHGIFPSLVRFCMSELASVSKSAQGNKTSRISLSAGGGAPSETDSDMEMTLAVAFVEATTDQLSSQEAEVAGIPTFRDLGHHQDQLLTWIEGVLTLLNAVVLSQTGATVLTENGVIPALLSAIGVPSACALHTSLISQCVQTVEGVINNQTVAANLYRDLNGVGLLVDRLMAECSGISMTGSQSSQLNETKKVLIVSLLVTLSVSFHSQGIMTAGATSRTIRDGSTLSKVLLKILNNIEAFGPVIFAQASVLVSDIINNDPSSVNHVHSSGIADAYLKTLTRWDTSKLDPQNKLVISPELIVAVPPLIGALSLTSAHADSVIKYAPLVHLMDLFALPCYVLEEEEAAQEETGAGQSDIFGGDVAAIVGAGVFELMRHNSTLQEPAVRASVLALKKMILFGQEQVNVGNDDRTNQRYYRALLKMANHVSEILEPILSKSEHATIFADQGGIDSLLKLYQLILPGTASFLSSASGSKRSKLDSTDSSFFQSPAAQSITLALRSYASQQPTQMLAAVIKSMGQQLDVLHTARQVFGLPWVLSENGDGAEGVLTSLPDIELKDLLSDANSQFNSKKVGHLGDYLRILATLEWLSGLLVWTMSTAQNHLQSQRWFTDLISRSNQLVLRRLYAVDRSIQFERASVAAHHRKKYDQTLATGETVEDNKKKANKPIGLWKLGSVLLLRFSLMMRSMLCAFGKTLLSVPPHHRRGDDQISPLASHAKTLAAFVARVLNSHLTYMVDSSRAPQMDPFVRQYYLTFLLETFTSVIYEGRRKTANTVVLVELMKPQSEKCKEGPEIMDTSVSNTGHNSSISMLFDIVNEFVRNCYVDEENLDENPKLTKMDRHSFSVALNILRRLSDLESVANSPLSSALVMHEETGSTSSGSSNNENSDFRFDPKKLTTHLHLLCARVIVPMWNTVHRLAVRDGSLEIFAAATTLLKNRLDAEDKADGEIGAQRNQINNDRNSGMRALQSFLAGNSDAATLGATSSRQRRTSTPFRVDPTIVETLMAMGFTQSRVEHALRRLQINDVEVAMEFMLSHPDEEGSEESKEADSASESADESHKESENEAEEKKAEQIVEEKELFDLYKELRDHFESVCFSILLKKCTTSHEKEEMDEKEALSTQVLVKVIAEYMSYLCISSSEERDLVLQRIDEALMNYLNQESKYDSYVASLTHLLALILRSDENARHSLLALDPSGLKALLDYISESDQSKKLKKSCAPVLLIMDSICRLHPEEHKESEEKISEEGVAKKSEEKVFVQEIQNKLVDACVGMLRMSELDKSSAHAIFQLLCRLTLNYSYANKFFLSDGVSLMIDTPKDALFAGYQELTTTILTQMMESPEVLEHVMVDQIRLAITKLSSRFGAPTDMRITPRALLTETAAVAARDETIFMKALQRAVQFRKTDSGRTYVLPKKDSAQEKKRSGSSTTVDSQEGKTDKDKKETAHHHAKLPKPHRQQCQSIVNKLVAKILQIWNEEEKSFEGKESSSEGKPIYCTGTFLHFLAHLSQHVPIISQVVSKTAISDRDCSFVTLLLREFLPSKELCTFAAIRKNLKEGGNGANFAGILNSDGLGLLTARSRSRITNTQRLLVTISRQHGESSKVVILTLMKLLKEWPESFGFETNVMDEDALSALHAWTAITMSILWPKGGTSRKSFAWDKLVIDGDIRNGRNTFVTLFANAIRKIDLTHPLAHTTVSMLLRPLSTLTRSFITRRIKKIEKKRGNESNTQNQAAATVPAETSSLTEENVLAIEQDVAALQTRSEMDIERIIHYSDMTPDDVAMHSPLSTEDHEMGEHPDISSSSEHSSSEEEDEGEEEEANEAEDGESEGDEQDDEEDEEDDEDDDDDDDDEDDEDDDDDDDEDDEEEQVGHRIRIRGLRRGRNGARRTSGLASRFWGPLDTELSILDSLDEVDESEFSYATIVEEESLYAEEQARRARRQNQEQQTEVQGEDRESDRSVADFSALGNFEMSTQTSMLPFYDEDYDDDPPSESSQNSVAASSQNSRRPGTNAFNALLQQFENFSDAEDDIIFDNFDGAQGTRLRVLGGPSGWMTRRSGNVEGRTRGSSPVEGLIHPLLQSSHSSENTESYDTDNQGSGRLSLPHQPSLLRELQELTEQVQSQLPVSFGSRSRGRDGLGSRRRPPSRQRLSAMTSLLSDFPLDPTQLSFNRRRPQGGNGRDGNNGNNVDVRSVASRLERQVNALYRDQERQTINSVENAPSNHEIEEEKTEERPSATEASISSPTAISRSDSISSALSPSETDMETERTAENDATSETASVLALVSTLGESSLQSPMGDRREVDETQEPTTPPRPSSSAVNPNTSTPPATAETQGPPPAPISAPSSSSSGMLNFTLDLSNLSSEHGESRSEEPPPATEQDRHAEDNINESSSTENSTSTSGLVCPDGIDPEVFMSLPPDMQAELVAQSASTSVTGLESGITGSSNANNTGTSGSESFSQMDLDMENSSFDRETLEALPPDIRAEVLANERREREAMSAAAAAPPADVSRAEEMDNASFVASLAPELREEILITCDDAFLQTLPQLVRSEANVLRERAAFRSTFSAAAGNSTTNAGGATGGQNSSDGLFHRPTLRRMMTSNGEVIETRGSGSRRGRHHLESDEKSEKYRGLLRVDKDESEDDENRILEDNCVRSLIRLLFMTQSVIQNRVFQRVLINVCHYPLTRQSVRLNILHAITLPLERTLLIKDGSDSNTKFLGLYEDVESRTAIPVDIINRILHVLVSVAKYNPRFSVELLHGHGMIHSCSISVEKEVSSVETDESGVAVLIDLLGVPVVAHNATNLDTLLELLELVLSPLDRIRRKSDSSEKKDQTVKAEEEEKESKSNQVTTSSEKASEDPEKDLWVNVPEVEIDEKRMEQLVGVLCMNLCSNAMQQRAVNILKYLERVDSNRTKMLKALTYHAATLSHRSRYKKHGIVSKFEASAVLSSAQDELKLLRLLHTLSDVCETTEQFNECCQSIGFEALWDTLSTALAEARENGGLEETSETTAALSSSLSAAVPSDASSASPVITAAPTVTEDDQNEGMVIEGKSAGASCAMAALLARFLPMVEAFFVVNARDAASMKLRIPDSSEREEAVVAALRKDGLGSSEETAKIESKIELQRVSSTVSEQGESMRLANFVEANRVLLNLLIREKPSLLDSSLAALIKMPHCRAYLDFDNKRSFFQAAMKKLRQMALRSSHGGGSSVRIPVRRDHVFEDSYYALRMRSGEELRRKLHISFSGEEGIDAGGVTREWYVILAREIFNPNYALFAAAADSPTFQPNPLSFVNRDHLSYFEFVGKVIGKAVADGQLLDAHFTRSFYKHILQLPISYSDMEAIDPEYYRNLHAILDHPIEELGLELTFSAEQSNFGRMEIVDLIPNGRHIAVTDTNKMEYVQLVTHHRMATGIRQQIDAFLKGFHQLVSPEMISIFNENELELLISGMPEIDIDDLKANTEYANFKPTDQVIRWFWNVLYSFNHEERALFLQFVTGTSKVPLEGFKALEGMRGTQKFNIHKAFGNKDALPSAHTCFNQLDLPEYDSEEKLKQRLLLAIREGSEGFGFG